MKKLQILPVFFALLAVTFWGMSFVWVKIVFEEYKPLTVVVLRLVISSLLLFVIYLLNSKREKIYRKDLPIFFLLAFCEPFMYFLGESFGLQRVTSTLGSIIISTIPVFSPIFAFFILKEKLGITNYLGLALSFTGVIVMVIKPDLTFTDDPLGILLMFLAVVSAIFYTIVLKRIGTRYSPVNIVMLQNAIGIIYFLPLFFIFDFQNFIQVIPTQRIIIALLELTVFASILAFFFYIKAVNILGVTRASAFTNLIPVITVTAAAFLINEIITFKVILGMTIVLSGVFLSQIKIKS